MENKVNIHVREGEFDYTVFLSNNHSLPASLVVDFGECQNLKLTPRNYSKQIGPMQVELTAEPGCQKVVIAVLDQIERNGNVKFHYKTIMKQSTSTGGASVANDVQEEDEVTNVADGLDLICRSVETGYKLFAKNTNATTGYELVVDIGKSTNLKLVPDEHNSKLLEPFVVSAVIPANAGFGPLADCPVADMTKGECEIQFQIRARVSK